MGQLATRTKHEDGLAAAVLGVFRRYRDDVLRGVAAVDWSRFAEDLAAEVQPLLAAVFLEAGETLASGRGVSSEGLTGRAEDWALRRAFDATQQMAANIHRDLAGSVVVDREAVDVAMGSNRAEAFAVTETTRSITEGEAAAIAFLLLFGEGEPEQIWNTADVLVDSRGRIFPCRTCQPLDRKPRSVWGAIVPGGPPAHPYCRCFLTYRLP